MNIAIFLEHVCTNAGGDEALLKAANISNTILPLRLRPDCAEDHAVYGQLQKQRGLLVKIRKRKLAGETDFSAEIVASVIGSYRFVGLADFQVAPDAGLQIPKSQVSYRKLPCPLLDFPSAWRGVLYVVDSTVFRR